MMVLAMLLACSDERLGQLGPDAGFALEDVNPTSPTFGQLVGPADFGDQRILWYFGHAN